MTKTHTGQSRGFGGGTLPNLSAASRRQARGRSKRSREDKRRQQLWKERAEAVVQQAKETDEAERKRLARVVRPKLTMRESSCSAFCTSIGMLTS